MNPYRRGAASVLLLLLSSCSGNGNTQTSHEPPEDGEDLTNVIYVGGVTDEALERLTDAKPKDDPRQALVIESPDLTVPLPADKAPTFEYRLASTAQRAPAPRLGPSEPEPSKWRRPFREFLQLLAPIRVAHAHGAPYNGTAYYIVISDADSKPRLQVFTTELSFTPEAVDWQNLVQAPQPLTLTITSAYFQENSVPADGGPFIGGSFPFRIE